MGGRGLLYGAAAAGVWSGAPLLVLAAAPLMALGSLMGQRLHELVAGPGDGVRGLVLAVGLALPAATGIVDLALRVRTP